MTNYVRYCNLRFMKRIERDDIKERQRIAQEQHIQRAALAQPVDAINMSQERVDETAKGEHKREWVGLTDQERADWHSMGLVGVEIVAAHLKEKNT